MWPRRTFCRGRWIACTTYPPDRDTMADDIWKRREIESPCVKLCLIHPEAGLCTGCLRSLDEIARWSRMSPEERRDIMAVLPDRKGALIRRRGGRAARMKRRAGGSEG